MPLLTAEMVPQLVSRGRSARRNLALPAKFKPGDAVVARNIHSRGHTRIPRYVRGRRGIVERDHGVFVFPDTNAELAGEKPQHVYSVRFSGRELWGPDASARDVLYVDLWDDYLDPA
jgi:nitrile hydratase subunit beta